MKMESNVQSIIKVIIVEDYKLTRVGLRCALNDFENIQVVGEAASGEEGLEKIFELKPDVVLMDLGLPKMNGLEALEQVKKELPSCNVIVLTSHEREEEVNAALGLGAKGYCLKDITPNALAEAIRNVAQGACYISPQVSDLVLKAFPKPGKNSLHLNSETNPQNNSNENNKILLTEREQEVLKLLVDGKSNTEIAHELIVSVHTAKAHVCSILQKLCVEDRVQAAVKAIRQGLV